MEILRTLLKDIIKNFPSTHFQANIPSTINSFNIAIKSDISGQTIDNLKLVTKILFENTTIGEIVRYFFKELMTEFKNIEV